MGQSITTRDTQVRASKQSKIKKKSDEYLGRTAVSWVLVHHRVEDAEAHAAHVLLAEDALRHHQYQVYPNTTPATVTVLFSVSGSTPQIEWEPHLAGDLLEGVDDRVLNGVQELHAASAVNQKVRAGAEGAKAPDLPGLRDVPVVLFVEQLAPLLRGGGKTEKGEGKEY
jgi:hypothetical protein